MLAGQMFAWIAITWLGCAVSYDFKEVSTPLGKVRGVDYGNFLAFKGLPYAEPPRRFAAPTPKQPWPSNVTRDATHFGDACESAGSHRDSDPLESYGESEDCLFANVWVPKVPKADVQGLPVMVWIHGGGFMVRTANFPGYWGDGFVTAADAPPALFVTFNYRLAVFGFYSSADTGANFGFQDQQLVLKWVRDNIRAFGGDPSRVTLSGQSAGAMSVLCHLAAPGSRDLFHRAIAESPVGLHYRSLKENAPFGQTVAASLGCVKAKDVTECIRSKPAWELKMADIVPEYLFHLFSPCEGCDNLLAWLPVIDGDVLPMSPVEAFHLGLHSKVPTIVSTTQNETLAFVPTILREVADNNLGYKLAMQVLFRDRASDVKHHYAKSPDTAHMKDKALLLGFASTDALMTCYGRYVVKLLSQYAPAFLSTFMLAPHSSEMGLDDICVRGPPNGASCHSADIAFFLPQSARMTHRTGVGYKTPQELQLASKYTATLINFTYGMKGPFEMYSNHSDGGTSWNLGGSGNTTRYHKEHCDFLESIGFMDSPWGASSPAGLEDIVI